MTEPNESFAPYYHENVAAKKGPHKINDLIEVNSVLLLQVDNFESATIQNIYETMKLKIRAPHHFRSENE